MEPPAKLRGHLLYLADIGGDPDAVLAGSGVTFESIKALERLENAKIAELLDLLAARTPDDFAIRCGLATRFQYMGVLGFRLVNCATLGELLETWTKYSVVIGYPLASSLEVDGDYFSVRFWPRYPMSERARRLCMETTLAGIAPAVQALSGHRPSINQFGFPFPRPPHGGAYELLGCDEVLFNQRSGFVRADASELALPLDAIDPVGRAISDDYCRTALASISSPGRLLDQVKAILAASRGEYPKAAEVALRLGCGLRTLQRQLADENYSYHRLVDEIRRDEGLRLIRRGVALKVVAHRLGFNDVSSLRRAFRTWTGLPPGTWRKAQLQLEAAPSDGHDGMGNAPGPPWRLSA